MLNYNLNVRCYLTIHLLKKKPLVLLRIHEVILEHFQKKGSIGQVTENRLVMHPNLENKNRKSQNKQIEMS
jgi:hypothetical protein